MFVLRRSSSKSAIEAEAVKRWPWITCWYFASGPKNGWRWTGKLSNAKLFATSLQANNFRDERKAFGVRMCTVQMISKKELFEARLRNR